jgi:hypothetical protein
VFHAARFAGSFAEKNNMRLPRTASFLFAILVAACSSIDRDSAKSLGLAGQSATQSLAGQVEAAKTTLDVLNEWWAVHDALVCSNVTVAVARRACLENVASASTAIHPPSLEQDRVRLSDVMSKRAQAIRELNAAYSAFSALADYDAGKETATAINGAFAGINALSAAASGLAPGGAALPTIASSFTTAASGIGALGAEHEQARVMLAASKDLHTAVDALIAALKVERDRAASESLLSQLQTERAALYDSAVDAGLIAPNESLTAFFQKTYPNLNLARPPEANADVIKAAARAAARAERAQAQAAVLQSYDGALATLEAVSEEHGSLEARKVPNVDHILGAAKHLDSVLSALNMKM